MVPTKAEKPPKPIARKVAISDGAGGDRAVHGVERAGERAERHGDRQRPAELLDQIGGERGLVGEVRGLGFGVELEPRIVLDVALERRERRRALQAQRAASGTTLWRLNRLCTTGEIGPDLRIEHAAVGIEHADHGPARSSRTSPCCRARSPGTRCNIALPTTSSLLPGLNMRPSISLISLRIAAPSGPMPRSGRLALVPLERLTPSTMR